VTGHRRGLKQKLRAGYRAPSLQRTSCPKHLHYNARHIFNRRVCYQALSMRYTRIRRSGIILAPTLPLWQISFLWWPPLLS